MRTESRFPPGGGFYSVVTGADIRCSDGADLEAAYDRICGAMVPPEPDQAEDWVAMLQAACKRRTDSEASAAVALSIYVAELCQWPADVARQACMNIARGKSVSGATEWFPSLAELSRECETIAAGRRAMLEALKGRAPKALERYPTARGRPDPTAEEIARVQAMKAEALAKLEEAAERSKPPKVPLPSIHGKADETGITPQLRAIIEREREG